MKKILRVVAVLLPSLLAIIFLVASVVTQSIYLKNLFLTMIGIVAWADFFTNPNGRLYTSSRTGIQESVSTLFVAIVMTVVVIVVWVRFLS